MRYFFSFFLILLTPFLLNGKQISRQDVLGAIHAIDQLIIDEQKKLQIPGIAAAIVFEDEMLLLKGYGVREAGKADLVDVNTVFQLASLSKPVTSSVISTIAAEGKLHWDSCISNLDPSFQLSDPWVSKHLTVADLLSHRSGLFSHSGDLLEDLGFSRQTILHQLRFIPKLRPFRASYAYSNFAFSEAGYAVANFLNQPWERVAKEKLFTPLRMRSASYSFNDYESAANKAVNHFIQNGKPLPLFIRNPDPQAPAGGASMSIKDFAKWMIFSLHYGEYKGNRLVPDEIFFETQVPHSVRDVNAEKKEISYYGLGLNIKYGEEGDKLIGHSGGFSLGLRTAFLLIPEKKVGIAIFTNSSPHAFPEGIAKSFLDLLYYGEVKEDWIAKYSRKYISNERAAYHDYKKPENYTPSIDLHRYEGEYFNKYFGPIEVKRISDRLVLFIGPRPMQFPLRHYNKDTFIMKTVGENSVNETKVVFEFSAKGEPKRVVIDYLNNNGLGVFLPSKDN